MNYKYIYCTCILCWILLLLKKHEAVDPCTDYTKLDEPDRSALVADGKSKCDSAIKEGWYRSISGAGPDIPNSAVPLARCGTLFPIWMDDTLPVNNTEKDVKLCKSHFDSDCESTFTIKVRNCGDFNVYQLKQTDSCPSRYCFGSNPKCAANKYSENGYEPGCGDILDTTLSMSVIPGETNGDKPSTEYYHKVIEFKCKLDSEPDNKDDLRFRVEWFIEDNAVSTFNDKTYSELENTNLSEDKWVGTYTMGFNVKCKMRLRNNTTVYGPAYESDFFYAGFKISANQIYVKEKEAKEISIWLTVPVGCVKLIAYKSFCFINIRVWIPDYQNDKMDDKTGSDLDDCPVNGVKTGAALFKLQNQGCGVRFEYESWNVTKSLTIIGQADGQYNTEASRLTHVRLQAEKAETTSSGWSHASVPDIKVFVSDADILTMNKACQSTNDPHMLTFDGRAFEYHIPATSIMLQNKRLPISVQATFATCPGNSRVTCNCGVAIRNDDSLFIANFCGQVSYTSGGPRNNYIANYNCDDKHMTITQSGNTYTVLLPTGTTVIFKTWSSGISYIHIKPSPDDREQSSGLCGYFDDDTSNDFKLRDGTAVQDSAVFAEDWRVKGNDLNLFDANLNLQPSPQPLPEYCICNDSTPDSPDILCKLHSAMITCKKTTVEDTSGFFKICGKSRTRRDTYSHHIMKREAEESEELFDIIQLTYPLDYQNLPNVTATWTNGWNEESARQKCIQYFGSSKMVSVCNDLIPNFDTNVNRTIEECILDIKLTGDTTYMETSLSSLANGCVMEAKKFENLTTSNSTSGNSNKSLLDDILDKSCTNNCSGHGICVKGNCECFDDFHGYYCNLRRSTPPSITKNGNTGLCQTDKKSCRSYGIAGDNMIKGSLKCRARHFKIFDNNEIERNDTVLEFNGTYVNEFSCICTVPESRKRRAANPETVIADGYYISISNDGINFSDEITLINYDSTCYQCNTTATTCSPLDSCPTTITTTTLTTISSSMTTTSATASTSSPSATTTTPTVSETEISTSEAALSTATSTTTTSAAVMSTTTPTPTSENSDVPKKSKPSEESKLEMFVAIAIATVAVIVIVGVIVVCIMKKKTAPKRRINLSEPDLRIGYGNDYMIPSCAPPIDTKYRMRPSSAKSIELDFNAKF